MKVLSDKATKILLEVADRIVKYPETYDPKVYFKRAYQNIPFSRECPEWLCGTTACIAGHVVIVAGINPEIVDIRYQAKKTLGLTHDQAMALFTQSPDEYWPSPFAKQWVNARGDKEHAEITAARIHHFIETSE